MTSGIVDAPKQIGDTCRFI